MTTPIHSDPVSSGARDPEGVVEPLLVVEDLRAYFETDHGVARAVDGVGFEVQAGEIVGLVGESGSGKSVTSLAIMRLLDDVNAHIAEGSSIRFDGRELRDLDEQAMRRLRGDQIAMIFQEPMTSLNPVYTVGEQIAESLRLHLGLGRAAARARAIEMLRLVEIAEPESTVDRYPHTLSGGQRQRVMIAMALACEPKLLIADEPTTALDVTIQAQILDLLVSLRDRLGTALLLITHDLGVVAEICDRVLVMYAGQVVEQAPVEDLLRAPRHPYTQGLIRALPRVGVRGDHLAVIPGTVPAATNWPSGCRFHPRCAHAWTRCTEADPIHFELPSGHSSRCWLEAEPERARHG